MAFDHIGYQQRYQNSYQQAHQATNDATSYGVTVEAAPAQTDAVQWKAIGVHHLTPDENRSRHNAFVDILDEQGQPVRDASLRLAWTWEGRHPDEDAPPQPLDKSTGEPAGNIPLFKGGRFAIWISDPGALSDRAVGISTEHPDEPNPDGELFNTIGHHSFYVVFQRMRVAGSGEQGGEGGGQGGGGEEGGGGGEEGGGGGQGENGELALKDTLLAEGDAHQVIQFNPDAALQKRIFADGFVPNSPEFLLLFDGVSYVCQRAESLATGEVRVYHVIIGDWGNVQVVSRAR